jgi:aminodeoxyfutalosine synthase
MNEQLLRQRAGAAGLADIADKVFASVRLDQDDALRLYRADDLNAVGALADWKRRRMHGSTAYFNINQHVNYTNLCNKLCSFCAFQRLPGQDGAYCMTPEEAAQKVRERLHEPVTEVHMVAGIWPQPVVVTALHVVASKTEMTSEPALVAVAT